MRRSAVLASMAVGLFCAALRAAVPDYAHERAQRVKIVQGYRAALKDTLSPGIGSAGSSREQLRTATLRPPLRPEGAVFAFRVPIVLAHPASPDDARLAIAFEQLNNLYPFLRVTLEGDHYVLPDRKATALAADAVYDGEIPPNVLSYAARAYAQFYENPSARAVALGLWRTVHRRYKGPIVTGWNPRNGSKSAEITQASLIYPWASSGFKLFKVIEMQGAPDMARVHTEFLGSSTKVALKMLRKGQLPVEALDASTLAPLTKGTFGQPRPVIILGHYAQILNFLLRAHQRSVAVQGQDLPKTVYEQFKYLLEGTFIDPATGGLGNGYIQDTAQPVEPWGRNLAYWQQCELAAALDRAIRLGIFDHDGALRDRAQRALLASLDLLERYFEGGTPRAANLNAQGAPTDEDRDDIPYILPYHTEDLLDQLTEG